MILKISIIVLYIGLSSQYLHYPTPFTDDTGEKVTPKFVGGIGNIEDSCTSAHFSYNHVYNYAILLLKSREYSNFERRKYCKNFKKIIYNIK